MEKFKEISIEKIKEAQHRISGIVERTPLMHSPLLSAKWNKKIHLKLENMQPTGAFKLRGAANAILNLSSSERQKGVLTVSTGNHGKAVAYVAGKIGIKATIFISELVPKVKVDAMKKLGAEVIVQGKDQDEATHNALLIAQKKGMRYISAFDDPDVIAGQGTIALEILEQNPDTSTIVVPLSGGGLMSGIAFTAKAINRGIKIIGVTNDQEPAMYTSIKAGHIVPVGESVSLADALPGAIPLDNQYTFEMCKTYMDDALLITEEQIAKGMAYALLKEKQVLEGGGAAALALLVASNEIEKHINNNTAVICSGNSVAMDTLLKITSEYQKDINRLFE